MATTITTPHALRVMGVWVRRADALLAQRGLTNAAGAVADERERAEDLARDLAALDLGRGTLSRAG